MQPLTCEVEAKEWKIAGIKYLKSAKLCTQLSNNGVANKNQPKSIKKVAKKKTHRKRIIVILHRGRAWGRQSTLWSAEMPRHWKCCKWNRTLPYSTRLCFLFFISFFGIFKKQRFGFAKFLDNAALLRRVKVKPLTLLIANVLSSRYYLCRKMSMSLMDGCVTMFGVILFPPIVHCFIAQSCVSLYDVKMYLLLEHIEVVYCNLIGSHKFLILLCTCVWSTSKKQQITLKYYTTSIVFYFEPLTLFKKIINK